MLAAIDILRRRRSKTDNALLAYKDGRLWKRLEPAIVNDYLRQVTALEVTAKDFRTWHATVMAAVALADSEEPGDTQASRKRAISAAVKEVSGYLGNTPTVARTPTSTRGSSSSTSRASRSPRRHDAGTPTPTSYAGPPSVRCSGC